MNTPPNKPRNVELPPQIDHKIVKEEGSQMQQYVDPVSHFKITDPEKENVPNKISITNHSQGSVFDRVFFDRR